MPVLPSGLMFAISRDALFYHGGNWFKCPEAHFWYWIPDPDIMGSGPYSPTSTILRSAVHAQVPANVEDVKKFIHVLERVHEEKWGWRGEWLDQFPKYQTLTVEDQVAWDAWIASSNTLSYLQETLVECQKLADLNHAAVGMATFRSSGDVA
jgi:hypothetical protein